MTKNSASFFALISFGVLLVLIFCFCVPVFSPQKGEGEDNFAQIEALIDSLEDTDEASLKGAEDKEGGQEGLEAISVSAQRCVLIEAESGQIIYEKNAFSPSEMASTTKIMTALVVIKNLSLEMPFIIPKQAVGIAGSSMYLREGECFSIKELLYGLMLVSGNDCAVALAIACSGSVEGFVELMNSEAMQLGLEDTLFANPHGLPEENHYTTAFALAKITAKALEYPEFVEIVSTKSIILPSDGKNERYLTNHNRLLRSYEGAIGVKTGFTRAAGRCLVSAASRGGVTLVAVTLNDGNDWYTHMSMLNYGFELYERVELCKPGDFTFTVPVVGGMESEVKIYNPDTTELTLEKGEKLTPTALFPHFLYAPTKEGELVGYVVFKDEKGEIRARTPLVCAGAVEQKKLTWFEKIIEKFGKK